MSRDRGGAATGITNADAVLVVAGEPSGDRLAAGVARALSVRGVGCFGMGGRASLSAGVRLVADLRDSAGMGLGEVVGRLPNVARAYRSLTRAARDKRPRAAILVDYAEFNHHLGCHLRGLGIRVLRCVAPQVWAWRVGRLRTAPRSFDRLAVILPFEEPLWRDAGVDAHYVGHPSLDVTPRERGSARAQLGLASDRPAVALLPGSRSHEVKSLAPAMLDAVGELRRLGRDVEARLAVAPSLDESTRRWLLDRAARLGVETFDVDPAVGAGEWLSAFDGSLVASGTAALESALAGTPTVITYRVSRLTAAVARRVLRVPSIGLPNLVLGEKAYPELVQKDAEATRMACELRDVIDRRPAFERLARELMRRLAPPPSRFSHAADRIADLAGDWIGLYAGDPSRRVDGAGQHESAFSVRAEGP